MDEQTREHLIDEARQARRFSYSPYSNFAVGAALLCSDGTIYRGTNIENAAYSPSICAERSAIGAAVTAGVAPKDIIAVAVIAHDSVLVPPCGVCRQTLAEFNLDMRVILAAEDGTWKQWTMRELLPLPFDPSLLDK